MPIETATFVQSLNADNPPSDDPVQEGDNHFRLMKQVLKNTFPNATRAFYDRSAAVITTNTVLTEAVDKRIHDVSAAGGAVGITLPALNTTKTGWSTWIIKSDATANKVSVAAASGTIAGQTNIQLKSQYEIVEFVWTGTAWRTTQRSFNQWLKTRTLTANEALTYSDFSCLLLGNPGASNITFTLPTAVNNDGAILGVKNIDDGGKTVILDGSGSQTIDGELTLTLANEGDCVWLVATSGNWQTYNFKSGSGFGPGTVNTWTATQIFVGASLILAEQQLSIAGGNIVWNHNLGNHARVTVNAVAHFAKPSNMRTPQTGFLRIAKTGTHALTWNATFEFLDGDPDLAADSITIFEYFVASANLIYIWKVAGTSGYVDYNKGTYAVSTTYSQAHGLGALPSGVEVYLKAKNAENGYAENDYIKLDKDSGDNDRGHTQAFNTTTVKVQTGAGAPAIYPAGSGNSTVMTVANWDLIIRVYG